MKVVLAVIAIYIGACAAGKKKRFPYFELISCKWLKNFDFDQEEVTEEVPFDFVERTKNFFRKFQMHRGMLSQDLISMTSKHFLLIF